MVDFIHMLLYFILPFGILLIAIVRISIIAQLVYLKKKHEYIVCSIYFNRCIYLSYGWFKFIDVNFIPETNL